MNEGIHVFTYAASWYVGEFVMANSFGVFWMTQYMRSSLPAEMIESARIDGASDLRVFLQIALPLAKSALITLSLLAFLSSWNSYLLPLIMLNNQALFTLPLGLARLSSWTKADIGAQIMALSIGTMPIIIMLAFGSKQFIRGLISGALKG